MFVSSKRILTHTETLRRRTILSSSTQYYIPLLLRRNFCTKSTNNSTDPPPLFPIALNIRCPACEAPLKIVRPRNPTILWCAEACSSYFLKENRFYSPKKTAQSPSNETEEWKALFSISPTNTQNFQNLNNENTSTENKTHIEPELPIIVRATNSPTSNNNDNNNNNNSNNRNIDNTNDEINNKEKKTARIVTTTTAATVSNTSSSSFKSPVYSPRELYNKLDEHIVGQEEAKKIFSVGVYNHLKRLQIKSEAKEASRKAANATNTSDSTDSSQPTSTPPINNNKNDNKNNLDNVEVEKSNILIFGSTGSGKTLFAKTLAKLLNVPFVMVDANCFTQAGYVGEDVDSILTKLYVESGCDIEKTERGIVFIDEIDKKSVRALTNSYARDIAGEGVQQALLKILEGSVLHVAEKLGKRPERGETVKIDTSNILFIAGGAFSGLDKVILERISKKKFGFDSETSQEFSEDVTENSNSVLNKAEPRDFIQYGLIPEFVGRFSCCVPLMTLSESELVRVLTEPKHALVKQYQKLFQSSNVDLVFTDDALREIASQAIEMKTGARGLKSIIEQTLLEPCFDLKSDSPRRKLVISKNVVQKIDRHEFEFVVVDESNNNENDNDNDNDKTTSNINTKETEKETPVVVNAI